MYNRKYMGGEKKIVKELDRVSKNFLSSRERDELLKSLKSDKSEWFVWISQMKGILKNINKADAIKFSGLVMLLEQNPDNKFYQEKLKKFLIDRVSFYRYYDFSPKDKIDSKKKEMLITKIFRCLISRSFVGILLIILIVAFVAWFYLDRESCLFFVRTIIEPFLKAIK